MDITKTARTLRDRVEPLAAGVYFAPEAIDRYAQLGLSYVPGYFCSRGACLGRAPGRVIAAAFAVFEPRMVERAVSEGWSKTGPEEMLETRLAGAVDQLTRILGEPDDEVRRATETLRELTEGLEVAGRPIFAGLTSLPWPDSEWGRLWRAADLVREHRGDAHVAAWSSHLTACQVTLLTELWWNIPLGSYVKTRGYDDDAIAAARRELEERGLIEGECFTAEGEELRASIEHATDDAQRVLVQRLGGRADELFALLEPWSRAIVDAGEYPVDPSSLTRR